MNSCSTNHICIPKIFLKPHSSVRKRSGSKNLALSSLDQNYGEETRLEGKQFPGITAICGIKTKLMLRILSGRTN